MSLHRVLGPLVAITLLAFSALVGPVPDAAAHGPSIGGTGDRYYLRNSLSGGGADVVVHYGNVSDGALAGDWDGDSTDTVGVRRGNTYYLKNSHAGGSADLTVAYGAGTDDALAGDWDGDGTDTLGVRRGNSYFLTTSTAGGPADITFSFGMVTDVALVGDWDGDGTDTVALRRGNTYYLKNSHAGGTADVTLAYGTSTDAVLAGDWDGDGTDTLAVRRGTTFHLNNSHDDGDADVTFDYGLATDAIFSGDWNADGVDSVGLRRNIYPPPPNPVLEAQRILAKFAIPVGPADGKWGARTAQGMCTFRQIAGLPVSRGGITGADLAKLRAYNAAYGSLQSIPAPARNGRSTYLLATKTCQTMLYAKGGGYARVFRISTGQPQWETPRGTFLLGSTRPGWSCSTLYPEGCFYHSQGMNALYPTKNVLYSTYGNMYNKRSISGAYMLHGSGSVPTYPASHGCVRVTIADSDWLYRNVTNNGGVIQMSIIGSY
jgi:hypothetical protein